MKKLLVVFFVISIAVVYSFSYHVGLDKRLCDIGCEYDIIEYYDNGDMTLQISGDDIDKILNELCVEIIEKNYVSDRCIIEGYTSKLNKYIVKSGRKVNLQISISDSVIVGYPLIKNSF